MAKKDRALVHLWRNLREAREAKGWSQEELAHRCGVKLTYMGGLKRAEYNVTMLTLIRVTKALRIKPVDALAGI